MGQTDKTCPNWFGELSQLLDGLPLSCVHGLGVNVQRG
jgi:hypothetical protein